MPAEVPTQPQDKEDTDIKVYEAAAETLSRLGVEKAFGLVGSGNFGLVDHMTRNCGVTFHASRHEEAAVAMADGYARVSSKLGVCSVHQGPGVTNTLTALTEAVKNGTPMLLLAGDTATTALYQNLDVDQDAVVRSIGAGVEHVRSAHTAVEDLARAVWRATTERRPVAVSLPIDLQEQSCEAEDPPAFAEEPIPAPRPSGEAIPRVTDLVEASSRPAIIADAAQSSFLQAALTAAFNAGAGILGFPPEAGWPTTPSGRAGDAR
jgi:thiamine pyrophosphate-dependent acetolactate synthase large subunit-like protein